MKHIRSSKTKWCVCLTCLAVIGGFLWISGSTNAAPPNKTRVVTINGDLAPTGVLESPVYPPLNMSLVTAVNRGGTGSGSFYVGLFTNHAEGEAIQFQVKENQPDVLLPLTEAVPIEHVWIRCDSSDANCRFTLTLVGK